MSRITHFVEGANEEAVRVKLVSIGLQLEQKVEVINVYHNAARGKVIAWYFHDTKKTPLPRPEKVSNKKVTKKARKSVSK